jgi:hypothetical protein
MSLYNRSTSRGLEVGKEGLEGCALKRSSDKRAVLGNIQADSPSSANCSIIKRSSSTSSNSIPSRSLTLVPDIIDRSYSQARRRRNKGSEGALCWQIGRYEPIVNCIIIL